VNRDYGKVVLPSGLSFPEASISAGWVKLRDDAAKKIDESEQTKQIVEKLELEQAKAKADSKGLWAPNGGKIEVEQEIADVKSFVEEQKGKQLDAVVERVLTGDRVILRFLLDQDKHIQAMVLIAGIRAPATKRVNPSDGKEQPAEPFGEEATFFLESRILQRTVHVQVVGSTPQGQPVCAIAHQQGGDMAGHLLRAGLARCVDHHSTMLGAEMSKLRQAEKEAKDKKLNVFRDHVTNKASGGDSEMTVVRIQTADTIFVRGRNNVEKKINFSSIRQPKPTDPKQSPFQAEAKEFLRKKLIGKHVKVSIDGKKAASEGYEEREVATVTQGGKNVALQLVEAGYASVIRHRRDDTDRSPHYDELLAAEEAATKEGKGMWSGKPSAAKNYVDYSESLQKAKVQASVLVRQRKIPAIVDFVKGPSRFTVLIPRENAKLTLVLSGIRAPKSARNPGEASDPFGQEALEFANRKCLQRDVEVDIEGTDKVGGFIGTLYVNRENFTKLLVEEGYASVHAYSAEQSAHGQELFAAEKKAKDGRKGIWKDYDPSQDEDAEEDATGTNGTSDNSSVARKIDYKEVAITHIDPTTLRIKLQLVGTGTGALEDLMNRFRSFHVSNKSSLPSIPPKVGDLVSAKFSEDNTWYRARVRRNDKDTSSSEIVYVDFGNEEKVQWKELRPLPPQFDIKTLRAQAQDAVLSFVQFPTSQTYIQDAASFLYNALPDRALIANIDYTDPKDGTLYVTLFDKNLEVKETESVNMELVAEGLAMVPRKLRPWEKNGQGVEALLSALKAKEKEAKDDRRGIWEYGDLTEDD
jgi:staphylococcal nuclease domain-containing protein 1